MKLLISDIKKLPKLFLGFIILAIGLLFTNKSDLGMLPWGVFHTGVSRITGFTFGQVIQGVGIIILILSIIFIKVEPGIGTIFNVILIGYIYDYLDKINIICSSDDLRMRIIYLLCGILLGALGSSIYISCNLGAGPRDGLFVGVTQITGISVKYTKPIIEITALIVGILLHGEFGYGTVINALISGYIINFFFHILKYDPKKKKNRSIRDYFKKES